MNALVDALSELAVEHLASALSEQRDGRLIFPGLTSALAKQLHSRLSDAISASPSLAGAVPVYLALDDSEPSLRPNADQKWLHFEAVTSVRNRSFVAVCMPKVLPKLHDSISGTGSPVRGLAFEDEWPWTDAGLEAFKFEGPVLDKILEKWGISGNTATWLHSLVTEHLVLGARPLRDAVRVPLLLEEILGGFSASEPAELNDPVDRFLFHCGLPCRKPDIDGSVGKYAEDVVRVAKALDELRRQNPEFRSFLIEEVAATRFAAREDLIEIQAALGLMLDGVLEHGVESGVLAFRGGLGNTASGASVSDWKLLDLGLLEELLDVGQPEQLSCRISLPKGGGVLSADQKQAAIFAGAEVRLEVELEIPPDRFVQGEFSIRCKRRTSTLHSEGCTSASMSPRISIGPSGLPENRSRVGLTVQLLRHEQVSSEVRVYVHICGNLRPALAVLEPNFIVEDLVEVDGDGDDSESLKHRCIDPVTVHVLDWEGSSECEVDIDDDPVDVATVESASGDDERWRRFKAKEAIDIEQFPGGRVVVGVLLPPKRARYITLEGMDVEPGEFTLEDELRVALSVGSRPRISKVAPLFDNAPEPRARPTLGAISDTARWRMDVARLMEDEENGWKPLLVDFLDRPGDIHVLLASHSYWRARDTLPTFLATSGDSSTIVEEALNRYRSSRAAVLRSARAFSEGFSVSAERPLYVACPQYVACDSAAIEERAAEYLDSYSALLALLHNAQLSRAERLLIVSLDAVVFTSETHDRALDFGVTLLGPWHPLVLAKRVMVQRSLHYIASDQSSRGQRFRRLASLLERVDGFRLLPGSGAGGEGTDIAYAFPTSDPGWHVALTMEAFGSLQSTKHRNPRGLGEAIRNSTGLRSPLYLAGSELWNAGFVRSFQRSHPSRRQLGIRLSRGLDPAPVANACVGLLHKKELGAYLPGGIHLYVSGTITEREPLPVDEPRVFLYENLEDEACYEHFRPDIQFLPQREDWRAGVSTAPDDPPSVPRGKGYAAAFFVPLVHLSENRDGVPVSHILESGASGQTSAANDGTCSIGRAYASVLSQVDAVVAKFRPQRPVLVQELGLPVELRCDWTILAGSQVDAGALAQYVTAADARSAEPRALWDYRLDLGRSMSSYFIVCKVPPSVTATLAGNPLDRRKEAPSEVIAELARAGFAVGETMRSGKAAIGMLGVTAALRLLRGAWPSGQENGRRWRTLLLPVDSFTGFLVPPRDAGGSQKRTDLLCIDVCWSEGADPDSPLSLSCCAVESKYASGVFPASSVDGAMEQASATWTAFTELLEVAQAPTAGMGARLALVQLVRFGCRLLSGRGELALEEESKILRSLLDGNFTFVKPLASSIVITTSAGDASNGGIKVQERGWWVRLTRQNWPREAPPASNELVKQLSHLFDENRRLSSNGQAALEPGTDEPTEPSSGHTPHRTSNRGVAGSTSEAGIDNHAPANTEQTADVDSGCQGAAAVTTASRREDVGSTEVSLHHGPVHPAFEGFVANNEAIEALTDLLEYAALKRHRWISNVGLFGPKSTGKTELARRVASALDVPYLPLSETGVGDVDQLAERMQEKARESENAMAVTGQSGGIPVLSSPPMLVFIDEVHQLKARVQDMLLGVLEPDDRILRGSRVEIDCRNVTFIIATTDWGRLREAFLSRVRQIRLRPYTVEEVARILQHRADVLGDGGADSLGIDPAVARLEPAAMLAIATAARAIPRVALDLLREVGITLALGRHGPSAEEVWVHLQRRVPCDKYGLMPNDKKYLKILRGPSPVGLGNIATQLGVDKSNVEGAIEPYLVQRGWVSRAASGRQLTPEGRALVATIMAED